MAWENVAGIAPDGQGVVENDEYWTSCPDNVNMSEILQNVLFLSLPYSSASNMCFGDTNIGAVVNPSVPSLDFYYNGSVVMSLALVDNETYSYTIYFGINEETTKGTVLVIQRRYISEYAIMGGRILAGSSTDALNNTELAYNIIKAVTPVAYNWTSVPKLTGKKNTISLVQIKANSMNDGDPVSDAEASSFSKFPDESNVGDIINDQLPYEDSVTDVLVKYKIKENVTGAFSVLKLVAKIGKIPESIEDGDVVVNISANKKKKLVTNLAEGTEYYFAIFAEDSLGNKAQSEPKKIKTGNYPAKEGIFKMQILVSGGISESGFKESIDIRQVS